jgi:serine/threonine-protein kinase
VSSGLVGFLTPGILGLTLTVWCVATVALTATVSRVVYGLVRQVREAMRFGQYTLRDKIGEGGMGAVYRAEHAMLRRPTAVKLLLPDRLDREGLLRFEREVQLTSQLSHPNTVAIYDYGRTPNGVLYYAMEYLDGASLEKLVADEGPQAPERVVRILEQAAGSLAEAHSVGLVHRDIKPGNILLCTRGGIEDFAKVIDFGLVKNAAGTEPTLTQVGALAGTPLFMAPEAASEPEKVSARTDTYALGAVGYFLLTGAPPFDGRTFVEICGHHLHSTPIPPSERLGKSVPAKLEALILRCLAKAPEARPDDRELRALLAECRAETDERLPQWGASSKGSTAAR